MIRIALSKDARLDLVEAWSFIARDSIDAANRLLDEIYDKCDMLAKSPRVGQRRPELAPSIRSLRVGNYVMFYKETAGAIEVARILHGRRDLSSFF